MFVQIFLGIQRAFLCTDDWQTTRLRGLFKTQRLCSIQCLMSLNIAQEIRMLTIAHST